MMVFVGRKPVLEVVAVAKVKRMIALPEMMLLVAKTTPRSLSGRLTVAALVVVAATVIPTACFLAELAFAKDLCR